MAYNINRLKTVAECDQAANIATSRKTDLLFEQTVAGRELTDKEKVTAFNNANLITVNAQIIGTIAAIDEMEEGEAKKEMQSKLRRLNDRKENLEERLEKGGNVALLDTELDAGLLAAQVTEIDLYLANIATRKAAL